MNTQEYILNLLQEQKSYFTKTSGEVSPEITEKKLKIYRETHKLSESEEILWAIDRTVSGKATDSCIFTNYRIRFSQTILGNETVKNILWSEIKEFFYDKKRAFVFLNKKGEEVVFDRMDFDVYYKRDTEQIDAIVKTIEKIIDFVSLKPAELPMSENEKKFMDDVKFMLEDDGKIIDSEKRILETMRTKYGVEENRAKEIISVAIENFAHSAMNDYMTEVENIIKEHGQIDETHRRALDFFIEKLDISTEKAQEIEQLVIDKIKKQHL